MATKGLRKKLSTPKPRKTIKEMAKAATSRRQPRKAK